MVEWIKRWSLPSPCCTASRQCRLKKILIEKKQKQNTSSLPLIEDEKISREKRTFTTHAGPLQYIRLAFGLTSAPASFQRILDHMIRDYIGKFVIFYIDGIFIIVIQVADLKVAHLEVWIDKCQSGKNSFKFLGTLIAPSRVVLNKKNIEAVTSFPIPTKLKDIRDFLDLCNYYQHFTKNYSLLAGPL